MAVAPKVVAVGEGNSADDLAAAGAAFDAVLRSSDFADDIGEALRPAFVHLRGVREQALDTVAGLVVEGASALVAAVAGTPNPAWGSDHRVAALPSTLEAGQAMDDIYEYVDSQLSAVVNTLHPRMFTGLLEATWHGIISSIWTLILSSMLSVQQTYTLRALLTGLRAFFHAGGDGITVQVLNADTRPHVTVLSLHDLSTIELFALFFRLNPQLKVNYRLAVFVPVEGTAAASQGGWCACCEACVPPADDGGERTTTLTTQAELEEVEEASGDSYDVVDRVLPAMPKSQLRMRADEADATPERRGDEAEVTEWAIEVLTLRSHHGDGLARRFVRAVRAAGVLA